MNIDVLIYFSAFQTTNHLKTSVNRKPGSFLVVIFVTRNPTSIHQGPGTSCFNSSSTSSVHPALAAKCKGELPSPRGRKGRVTRRIQRIFWRSAVFFHEIFLGAKFLGVTFWRGRCWKNWLEAYSFCMTNNYHEGIGIHVDMLANQFLWVVNPLKAK